MISLFTGRIVSTILDLVLPINKIHKWAARVPLLSESVIVLDVHMSVDGILFKYVF